MKHALAMSPFPDQFHLTENSDTKKIRSVFSHQVGGDARLEMFCKGERVGKFHLELQLQFCCIWNAEKINSLNVVSGQLHFSLQPNTQCILGLTSWDSLPKTVSSILLFPPSKWFKRFGSCCVFFPQRWFGGFLSLLPFSCSRISWLCFQMPHKRYRTTGHVWESAQVLSNNTETKECIWNDLVST